MNYWAKRNLETSNKLTAKSEKDIEKQLVKYYRRAAEDIVGQFEATYNKLLSTIGEGKQPTPADLYKLDKYWQMQGQLQKQLQELGDYQYNLFFKNFTDNYLNIYNAMALPSQETFAAMDRQAAEQLIQQVWCADGKNWSQRIWKNTNQLQQTLNDRLLETVITGKPSAKLRKLLLDDFGVSYRQADRIVRTELAHIQTQAAQKRYQDYGIKEVQVWADKDERRCDVCGKHHKERYPVNGVMPVPFHANCRCCIIPVVETNL